MFPAVVLSDSTRVRALGNGVDVYKSMLKPGGNAIVSNGKLSVCPATREDKPSSVAHNMYAAGLLSNAMFCLLRAPCSRGWLSPEVAQVRFYATCTCPQESHVKSL